MTRSVAPSFFICVTSSLMMSCSCSLVSWQVHMWSKSSVAMSQRGHIELVRLPLSRSLSMVVRVWWRIWVRNIWWCD